jgi:hypothetical protein
VVLPAEKMDLDPFNAEVAKEGCLGVLGV